MLTEAEREVIKKLLRFRWNHRGFDSYRCRSCGALGSASEENGRISHYPPGEKCSPNCPWQQAAQMVEGG